MSLFNELNGNNFGQSCKQDTLVSLVPTSVTVRVITAHDSHMVPYSVCICGKVRCLSSGIIAVNWSDFPQLIVR